MESAIQTNSSPAPRLRELDSLRGLAAIGVLFWHYQGHFHAKPLAVVFEAFYRAGYYAVDFFFVLSGLVLARAYANEYRSHRFAENMVMICLLSSDQRVLNQETRPANANRVSTKSPQPRNPISEC